MPKKTSSGSKKGRSDSYKSSDGSPKRTKSGEKKKPSRSKSKVKIEADEEKTIWYQDRNKRSAKEIKEKQDLHLAGKFPAVAGKWSLSEFKNKKGMMFLLMAHTGGVQLAFKERNAGEFFWRSPLEPKRKKGEEPGGVQVQPSGHRSVVNASSKMMPDVVDFDRIIEATSGQGADPFELIPGKVYKYGRFGFWLIEPMSNGEVHVTNSNKAVKETSYMVQVERIGALKFTDTDGGDHALADQDEIDRVTKKRERAANSQDAKRARAEKKKADALKKKTASKKLGKAGSAENEEPEQEEWTCQLCSTRGNTGDTCQTCRRPRGMESSMGTGKAARGRENAEAMRRLGESDVQKTISAWDKMDEKALKAATKAQVSKLDKMLRRFPWEPDRAVGFQPVELLKELELCKKVEAKLEKLIVEREESETDMKYVAFVLSAKRLKRQRNKPRKRKLKAKIDTMVKRIERVRSYKEEQVRRKEAGLKERSALMKCCLCCCCCLRICGLGKTKKNKVISQEEELMNMDIEDR